jgi:hypothetical protein
MPYVSPFWCELHYTCGQMTKSLGYDLKAQKMDSHVHVCRQLSCMKISGCSARSLALVLFVRCLTRPFVVWRLGIACAISTLSMPLDDCSVICGCAAYRTIQTGTLWVLWSCTSSEWRDWNQHQVLLLLNFHGIFALYFGNSFQEECIEPE